MVPLASAVVSAFTSARSFRRDGHGGFVTAQKRYGPGRVVKPVGDFAGGGVICGLNFAHQCRVRGFGGVAAGDAGILVHCISLRWHLHDFDAGICWLRQCGFCVFRRHEERNRPAAGCGLVLRDRRGHGDFGGIRLLCYRCCHGDRGFAHIGAEDETGDFAKALAAGGNFVTLHGNTCGQPWCILPDLQAVGYSDELVGGFLCATANADDGTAGKRNGDERREKVQGFAGVILAAAGVAPVPSSGGNCAAMAAPNNGL